MINTLWKPQELENGDSRCFRFGPLSTWIRCHENEISTASRLTGGSATTMEIEKDPDFPEDLEWSRWIVGEKRLRLQLAPQLPDRPIIVRPEVPLYLPPNQSVQLVVGIPVWLTLSLLPRMPPMVDTPTCILSKSWFGPVTEGELCYAMRTAARLEASELPHDHHHARCLLDIRNASKELLNIERLCLQIKQLNIYQSERGLWTNAVRVSYRGEAVWSRTVHSRGVPVRAQPAVLVGHPRDVSARSVISRAFENWKRPSESQFGSQ